MSLIVSEMSKITTNVVCDDIERWKTILNSKMKIFTTAQNLNLVSQKGTSVSFFFSWVSDKILIKLSRRYVSQIYSPS